MNRSYRTNRTNIKDDQGNSIRVTGIVEAPGVHRDRRAYTRARDWCEHRHLQRRKRGAAATVAAQGSGSLNDLLALRAGKRFAPPRSQRRAVRLLPRANEDVRKSRRVRRW